VRDQPGSGEAGTRGLGMAIASAAVVISFLSVAMSFAARNDFDLGLTIRLGYNDSMDRSWPDSREAIPTFAQVRGDASNAPVVTAANDDSSIDVEVEKQIFNDETKTELAAEMPVAEESPGGSGLTVETASLESGDRTPMEPEGNAAPPADVPEGAAPVRRPADATLVIEAFDDPRALDVSFDDPATSIDVASMEGAAIELALVSAVEPEFPGKADDGTANEAAAIVSDDAALSQAQGEAEHGLEEADTAELEASRTAMVNPEPETPWWEGVTRTLSLTRRSNLRAEPHPSSAILGKLKRGDHVSTRLVRPYLGYYRVEHGGTEGWVWWRNVAPAMTADRATETR